MGFPFLDMNVAATIILAKISCLIPPGCALNHATKRCMKDSCLTTPPVQGCLKLENPTATLGPPVCRPVGDRGAGGDMVLTDFGRSVNPISTRGQIISITLLVPPFHFYTLLRFALRH